jgi:membrane-associated protein
MEDFFTQIWTILKGIVTNLRNPNEWDQFLNKPGIYWSAVATLALIIFAETGLLVGFFLPGDSLLVTVGIIARISNWDIVTLMLVLCAAAIIGDTVGYWIGAKAGPGLFRRPDSRFFKQQHLQKAKAFFDRHGGKTIIIARFMPFARTFVPVVAGAAKMEYRYFLTYNVVGGIAWIVSMLMFGYTAEDWLNPLLKSIFGQQFELRKNIDALALVIIGLSLAPMVVQGLIEWRAKKKLEPILPPETPAP